KVVEQQALRHAGLFGNSGRRSCVETILSELRLGGVKNALTSFRLVPPAPNRGPPCRLAHDNLQLDSSQAASHACPHGLPRRFRGGPCDDNSDLSAKPPTRLHDETTLPPRCPRRRPRTSNRRRSTPSTQSGGCRWSSLFRAER